MSKRVSFIRLKQKTRSVVIVERGRSLVCLGVCVVFIGLGQAKDVFEPVGPSETASIERALHERLPVYAWSIWPRKEIIEQGKAASELRADYLDEVKWQVRTTVRPRLLNTDEDDRWEPDTSKWVGIRARKDRFIIGAWDAEFSGRAARVEIQAYSNGLCVSVHQKDIGKAVNAMKDEAVVQLVGNVLRLEKGPEYKVSSKTEPMGDGQSPIKYGIITADWDPTLMYYEWWRHIRFWVARDQISVNVGIGKKILSNHERWSF